MPHKVQDKPDTYQGQWRDGKIHGFGKYKSVYEHKVLTAEFSIFKDSV